MVIVLFIVIGYVLLFGVKEKAYFYTYNLFVITVGVFMCAKVDSSWVSLVYHIVPLAMFSTIFPHFKKYAPFIFSSLGFLLLYIVIKFVFWHVNIVRMFMDLRISIFAVCMGLSMIESIRKKQLNVDLLMKGLYFVVFVQVLIGGWQYLMPSINSFFFVVDDNATRDAEALSQYLNMNLIPGTMMSPSVLSGFLALSFFVAFTYEVQNHNLNFVKLLWGGLTLLVLFLTGIRTPFLMLFLVTGVYLLCFQRKLFVLLLPLMIVALVLLFKTNVLDIEGSIGRMLQGFTQASSGLEGLSETTLGYSFIMIPFFLQDPIFGISQYDTTIVKFLLDDMSKSDIFLLYILCEYGLVGLTLFLAPFFKFKKQSLKGVVQRGVEVKQSTVIMYVVIGLLFSIVDQGIFHYTLVGLVIMGIVLFSYKRETGNSNLVHRRESYGEKNITDSEER